MTELILACVPVDTSKLIALAPGIEPSIPRPYVDSIKATCGECGDQVWVGPKQQIKLAEGAPVLCFCCAVTLYDVDSAHIIRLNPDDGPRVE